MHGPEHGRGKEVQMLSSSVKGLLTIFLAIMPLSLSAYVHTLTASGKNVKWPSNVNSISLNVNASGCSASLNSCSSSHVLNVVNSSASQWSNNSHITFSAGLNGNSPSSNQNDVYFSSSAGAFSGTGVVAITQVAYKESTGEILEADIVVNASFAYEDYSGESTYLGNIITHEMGHLMGLGHGQVHNSSMFYSLSIGQYTLANDDISGAKVLYGKTTGKGTISGKIIGSSARVGIFGAHVQAISSTTGKIVAATFSKQNGEFSIGNLDLDDVYYIYVSPAKLPQETLPSYYSSVRADFCNGGQYYRGSFFQSCYNSERGHPQGVPITSTSSSYNVGEITIRCSLDTPLDYLGNKGLYSNTPDIVSSSNTVGYSQTGFFTSNDVAFGITDEFEIDLTDYSVPTGNIYLEARLLAQPLYSMLKMELEIDPLVGPPVTYPTGLDYQGLAYDSDGAPDFQVVGRVLLDRVTPANNVFTLTVTPEDVNSFIATTTYPNKSDYYPSYSIFGDKLALYLLTLNIVRSNGDGTYTRISTYIPSTVNDNKTCPDAQKAYSVSGIVSGASTSEEKKTTKGGGGCGAVDLGDGDGGSGGGPSGPISFLIGLMGAMVLVTRRRSA